MNEEITLQEFGENYLHIYDPRIPEDQQCSGWNHLRQLVANNKQTLVQEDLIPFHMKLRPYILACWPLIRRMPIELK